LPKQVSQKISIVFGRRYCDALRAMKFAAAALHFLSLVSPEKTSFICATYPDICEVLHFSPMRNASFRVEACR